MSEAGVLLAMVAAGFALAAIGVPEHWALLSMMGLGFILAVLMTKPRK